MGEAIRWAAGEAPTPGLLSLSVWTGGFRSRRLFEDARPSRACPVCAEGRFPALDVGASDTVKLCGRQSVQITPARRVRPDFEALESRLARLGRVRRSPQLLNADVEGEGLSLSIFSDGRVVPGTETRGARVRTTVTSETSLRRIRSTAPRLPSETSAFRLLGAAWWRSDRDFLRPGRRSGRAGLASGLRVGRASAPVLIGVRSHLGAGEPGALDPSSI
jgi:hypothetical protein